uniref:DNA-directed RNA polymerase n=1 Tax=Carcinus maenas virus 1 TaxID=2704945 RepID=A0A6G9HE50_9VIRU|nr:DNA-dependent RNA polymerase subunit RPB1 [Carcinus maenas virus 1]
MKIKFEYFTPLEVSRLDDFNTLLVKEKKKIGNRCFQCTEEECLGEYSVIRLKDCFVYNTHSLTLINKELKLICKNPRLPCLCGGKNKCRLKKLDDKKYIFLCNNTVRVTGRQVFDALKPTSLLFDYLVVPPLHLLTEHMAKFKIKCKNINQLCKNVNNNSQIVSIYHNMLYASKYHDLSLKGLLNSKEGLVVKNIIGKRSFMTMRAVITSHNYNYDTVYIPACIYDTIDAGRYNRDWAVLNRQPSLKRESMIAVKVKPVRCCYSGGGGGGGGCKAPVIKIPIQIVKPLNADFDGDECNLHFPSLGVNIDNMKLENYIIDSQNDDVLIGPIYEILDFIYYYFTQRCCDCCCIRELGYNGLPASFVTRWNAVNSSTHHQRCLLSVLSYSVFDETDHHHHFSSSTGGGGGGGTIRVSNGIIHHGSVFSKTTLCVGPKSLIYQYNLKRGPKKVIGVLYKTINDLITLLLETCPRPSMSYSDLSEFRRTKDYRVFETFLNSGGKLKKEHVFQATLDIDLDNLDTPTSSSNVVNYYDGISMEDVFDLAPKDRQSLIDSGNSKIAESGYLTKIILKLLDNVVWEKRRGVVVDTDTGTRLMKLPFHRSFIPDDLEDKYVNVGTLAALCITEYFSQMYLKSANVSNLSYMSEMKHNNFAILKSIFVHDTCKTYPDRVVYKLTNKQRQNLGEDFLTHYILCGAALTVRYTQQQLQNIFPNLNPLHCRILIHTLYQNGYLGKKLDNFYKFFFHSQYQCAINLVNETYTSKDLTVHDIVSTYMGLDNNNLFRTDDWCSSSSDDDDDDDDNDDNDESSSS